MSGGTSCGSFFSTAARNKVFAGVAGAAFLLLFHSHPERREQGKPCSVEIPHSAALTVNSRMLSPPSKVYTTTFFWQALALFLSKIAAKGKIFRAHRLWQNEYEIDEKGEGEFLVSSYDNVTCLRIAYAVHHAGFPHGLQDAYFYTPSISKQELHGRKMTCALNFSNSAVFPAKWKRGCVQPPESLLRHERRYDDGKRGAMIRQQGFCASFSLAGSRYGSAAQMRMVIRMQRLQS